MEHSEIVSKLQAAGVVIFKERTGYPEGIAQKNLQGKSDYVSAETLKANGTKIHSCTVLEDGLILGIVESFPLGVAAEDGKGFRPVFFNVFGQTIYRPKKDEHSATLKAAQSEFWKKASELEAVDATLEGLEQWQSDTEKQLQTIKSIMKELK